VQGKGQAVIIHSLLAKAPTPHDFWPDSAVFFPLPAGQPTLKNEETYNMTKV
jgi:hypothetical protein